jgi:hypothetical protein
LKKKHPDIESEINKYVLRWNSFSKFPDVHKDKIKPILKKYYPSLFTKTHYRRFLRQFELPQQNIQTLSHLSVDVFNAPEKYLTFNLGMGTGKTITTIKFLKQNQSSFIWIAPNRA